jgi:hypothetical protein
MHHLPEAIDRAEDLTEARRSALLRKLPEFDSELERKRLGLVAVTVLAITLPRAPDGLVQVRI